MKRPKRYSESQAMAILKDAIAAAGSLRKFAAGTKLSSTFISHVVNGRSPMSERLADEIGLRRVVEFEVTERSSES